MRSIAEYVRRHHIGLLALFVALGGTAYAVEIAPRNSVVSKSIKDGQVKPLDLGVVKSIEVPEEHVISISNPSDEFTMEINVSPPGLISVYARTELRKQNGAADETSCILGVKLPGTGSIEPLIQDFGGPSNSYFVRDSAPGTEHRGTGEGDGGWVAFPVPEGKQTITLSLTRVGTGASCRFRNTQFHVAPSS